MSSKARQKRNRDKPKKRKRPEVWPAAHFSQSNPLGSAEQANVAALLRRVADTLERLKESLIFSGVRGGVWGRGLVAAGGCGDGP